MEPVLAASVAHLWFVTIHPFEDGNGRIARAIADMALARSEESPERFYSMSAQIRLERKAYYDILEATQKGGLDITDWQIWFLECLARAIENAQHTLAAVLTKAAFWEAHAHELLNERQVKILNRLLDGFEGKLTSSKWAAMNRCSQDTANRDIRDLIDRRILIRSRAGGRSTSYELVTEEQSLIRLGNELGIMTDTKHLPESMPEAELHARGRDRWTGATVPLGTLYADAFANASLASHWLGFPVPTCPSFMPTTQLVQPTAEPIVDSE